METNDALKKIEEINSVIQSSNKALFSGRHMILYGIICFLIPVIGMLTQWLTFGYDFGPHKSAIIVPINILFYWGLSHLLGKFVPRTPAADKSEKNQHPLITKAFSVSTPIVVAIFGVSIIFSLIGHGKLVYPVVYILLGLMFSIFGRFTIPAVSYIAWSYIALGLVYAFLLQYDLPYLVLFFMAYNGLSYMIMGVCLNRAEKTHVH